MTDDSPPSLPLYRQVSNQIIENIMNGTFPVGQLIPTEQELSLQCGVSRHTVREAVRHVQNMGLVSRRQGQGTRVCHRQVKRDMKIVLRTFSDIEQHGYYTHLVDLASEVITLDAAIAADLHASPGDRFLHLRCFRVPTDDTLPVPTAWNETFIVADYAAVAAHIEALEGPIYLLIERMFGETIEEIEQGISAVLLDAHVASKLGVKKRSAGLRVKRTYRGKNGRPVITAFNTYAADSFSISMRMRHE
jgi:DNA-binding GntR family transcriptional regulator